MTACQTIKLTTPDSIELDALLFGSLSAKIGFIFIHGLSSSAFSHNDILPSGGDYLSLYINNRGHDEVTSVKHITANTEKGYDWFPAGMAHEVFTDCTYDIQAGVDLLKEQAVEQIYLVGHSTGCQKSIYHLAKSDKSHEVNGVVLICPMSDYAYALHSEDPKKLKAATDYAEGLVIKGEPAKLLPSDIWSETIDAQRFLSLYTPGSIEEIFTYAQPDKQPELLKKVKQPILVLIADKDEYADRPINEIAKWFEQQTTNSSVKLINGSLHSLNGKSGEIISLISDWLQTTTSK